MYRLEVEEDRRHTLGNAPSVDPWWAGGFWARPMREKGKEKGGEKGRAGPERIECGPRCKETFSVLKLFQK